MRPDYPLFLLWMRMVAAVFQWLAETAAPDSLIRPIIRWAIHFRLAGSRVFVGQPLSDADLEGKVALVTSFGMSHPPGGGCLYPGMGN